MEKNRYTDFLHDALAFIPQERIYTDELRRLAWGTDAGFYRLIPQIVIRSKDEDEVSQLLRLATRHRLPVTFRAAGTSLSGQAISNSILIVAGKHWSNTPSAPTTSRLPCSPASSGNTSTNCSPPTDASSRPTPPR